MSYDIDQASKQKRQTNKEYSEISPELGFLVWRGEFIQTFLGFSIF